MASLPLPSPPSPATIRLPACDSSPSSKSSSSPRASSISNTTKKIQSFSDSKAHLIKLINEFSQSPTPQKSILIFLSLLEEEDPFLLSPHAFPPLLKACAKLSASAEGTQIHSFATKRGMAAHLYVQNSLIQMYFACGRPSVAQLLFDKMPERTVVTWNCVIAGYSELGVWEKVISLYFMMIEEALVEPNLVTLVRAVKACTESGDFNSGRRIYGYIVENGVLLSLNLRNSLMNMFMKFGDIEFARELFDELPDPDVVSWTTLVSGYSGVGRMREAREVFDRMPDRNIVAWNAIIAGYVLNGCFEQAVIFYKMLVLDLKPDKSTFLSILSACAKSKDLSTGKVIHGYISKIGIYITLDLFHSILGLYSKCGEMNIAELLFRKMKDKNEISWTLMMTGYARSGEIEAAMEIFNKMPTKDIASWNALITTLAQNNHSKEALKIFEDMVRKKKMTPNSLTFVSSLSCCASIGALETGRWIHLYIERNNLKMDAHLSASLIDMYAKCGCIELSLEVFYRSQTKDLLVWSTIIRGLAMHGQSKLALEFFDRMEGYGAQLRPDAIAFLSVLSACSHAGLVEEGYRYFDRMTKIYGISPTIEHYGCMVDLLGRRGLLREAKEFINGVGMASKSEAIWGALLSGCKIHGDIKLAEYAVKRILELNPTNSGAYVLLSNVYAKEFKWDCVRKVRIIMKEKGVKKIPGFSSIEVNGVVHEFFAGDSSHSQSADIYLVLEGLEMLSKLM